MSRSPHPGCLTQAARAEIRAHDITVADYIRAQFPGEARWRGDTCGCPDDRCVGYHHEAGEDCRCLPVLVSEMVRRAS